MFISFISLTIQRHVNLAQHFELKDSEIAEDIQLIQKVVEVLICDRIRLRIFPTGDMARQQFNLLL